MKFFKCFYRYQESIVLNGTLWIDETFVPVNRSRLRHREDGKLLRGTSVNQAVICAGIGMDGKRFAFVAGRGHVSSARCLEVYGSHIEPGSTVIHDGVFSHDRLIREKSLVSRTCKAAAKSSRPMMRKIDGFCSMIKRTYVVHIGGKTEYLQDYLNWVCFKAQLKGMKYEEKVDFVEAFCFQNRMVFRRKDR